MTMTPKDALLRAREALDLEWTAEQQIDALTGAVEKLASELTSPESLLRTVQVLWLPDGAKERASAKRGLRMLAEGSAMLAQGPAALGWVKAAAWAALRIRVDTDRDVANAVSLMRSAAEWTAMPSRYDALVKEIIVAARDALLKANAAPEPAFSALSNWPSGASVEQARANPATAKTIEAWSTDPTTLHTELLLLQLREGAIVKAVKKIEAHVGLPSTASEVMSEPLALLWWGQSLYSPHLHQSYRDLPLNQCVFWMADDMAELGGNQPSEQRVAYFAETLRRVGLDLDASQTLRQYARDLAAACSIEGRRLAPPTLLADALKTDPTGLPITLLSVGTGSGIAIESLLAELESKVDIDLDREITQRQWATWVCRERLFLRFLASVVD